MKKGVKTMNESKTMSKSNKRGAIFISLDVYQAIKDYALKHDLILHKVAERFLLESFERHMKEEEEFEKFKSREMKK